MKKVTTPFGVLALLCVCGQDACAQDPTAVLQRIFGRYDRNGDGVVVRAEFPGSDMQFASMDGNKNGKVTAEEFRGSALAKRLLSARNRNAMPPRPRLAPKHGVLRRLEHLARFDPDRDGRITKAEWRGTALAFDTIDLNHDRVLDKKDRALARSRQVREGRDLDVLVFKSRLESPAYLFKRYDHDKDMKISRKEAGDSKLGRVFATTDRNKDGHLDEREVRYLVQAVNTRVNRRNRGEIKPRAYAVPFSAWDKNKDGRLSTKEFVSNRRLFGVIDVNRDGAVTKEEVARYKRMIEGKDFISRFDANGDGRVTRNEFAGPIDVFRRADRNGDGAITRKDR